MRVQSGQIFVSGFQQADGAAQCSGCVGLGGGDAGCVDLIAEGFTRLFVGEQRIGAVVVGQQHLIRSGPLLDGQAILAVQTGGRRSRNRCRHIETAVGQGLAERIGVGVLHKFNDIAGRFGAMVGIAARQLQGMARLEIGHGEWSGTYGLALIIGTGRLGIVDNAESAGQRSQQRRIGLGKRNDHRGGVRIGDRRQIAQFVDVRHLVGHVLLQRPHGVRGVQRMAVREGDARLQCQGDGQSVIGSLPACRQSRLKLVVLIDGH